MSSLTKLLLNVFNLQPSYCSNQLKAIVQLALQATTTPSRLYYCFKNSKINQSFLKCVSLVFITWLKILLGVGLVIMKHRMSAVRYLARTSKSRASFIFRMPALSYVSNILRLSFQPNLWVGVGILVLLMLAIIKFLFSFEVKRNAIVSTTSSLEFMMSIFLS